MYTWLINLQKRRVPCLSGSNGKDGKFRVDKFNDQKYQLWKMQTKDYLYQRDLFLPLGKTTNKLVSMKDEEWEVLDRKTSRKIWLCLLASISFNISKEKEMTILMKELAKLYEKPPTSNKVFLMKCFFNDVRRWIYCSSFK